MSTSSNITSRPNYHPFVRASDDAGIFVNMMFVRMISAQGGGVVRLHFGQGGSDHIDVKSSMTRLGEQLTP